jgi:tight adherence protein B
MKLAKGKFRVKRRLLATFIGAYFLSLAISNVHSIAIAIALVVSVLSFFAGKHLEDKRSWQLFEVLPELIDQIISGVQSGLSLNQSLISLESRGASFENSISQLQADFSLAAADQLFEALVFAKNLGGSELLALLRQLGDFTRQDLALRREISAKQGWIKNSAHLSAGAPWLLLLLLSAQPATAEAFRSSTGALILGLGVLLTVTAYIWMGRLSRLPEPARIFGASHGL